MISVISTFFKNLPTYLKMVFAGFLVVLGVCIALIPSGAMWIVPIGFVVFILLPILLYLSLFKWQKKRKAIPMERDLMKNASAASLVSGSDPKLMAQQDDLRKKFERGIDTFRANNNKLYDIPWYMIVGEPGSGKTEAIRHSNIGFPPGIQDMLQGSGGTINMNWWFTENAIILDTAGRMMFEQAGQGGGHDWKELLNLLKKHRNEYPINGVLLVIPADSLIRDTADEIGRKAEKIAQQFDVIQRTLDVRFPVFVVITKSDLINGFRDFFDNITDPRLQHQILGWSNTQPIDEPYRPDFIDQHVKMIKERLFRRRLALMQQIICGESGVKEKRLADILYTFPQSITSIAPRLARYLELIFRAGSRWSGKPLFFRGIYFTSSMREGSALDGELAETLGVPVESLPNGRAWERDRAYFLRDLLLKKVFPEGGLVTSAIDAKKQHTRRKFILLATIAASLLLLFIYIFFARSSYQRNIGDLNDYLKQSAGLLENDPNKLFVVQTDPLDPCSYEIVEVVVKENLSGMLADAIGNYKTQWMFIPIEKAEDIPYKLRDAARIIYKTSVLKPFLSAACDVMTVHVREKDDKCKWLHENDPVELRALHQLIRIKANKPLSEEETDNYSRLNFINNLSNFIIRHGMANDNRIKESRKLYDDNKSELHKPLRLEYKIFNEKWHPSSILKDDPNLDKAIETGIELFNRYWQEFDKGVLGVRNLKDAIEDFIDIETHMLELTGKSDNARSGQLTDEEQLRQTLSGWKDDFKRLRVARGNAEYPADSNDPLPLKALCEKVLQDVIDRYNFLLSALDPNDVEEDEFLGGIQGNLKDGLDKITKELEGCRKYFEQLENKFWASFNGRRLYEIRFEMYSIVNKRLNAVKKSNFDEIREIENADKETRTALDELSNGDAVFSNASELCNSVLDLDKQLRLLSVLQAAPNDIERIKEVVEDHNNWDWTRIPEVKPNNKFDPAGAANVMNSWKYLGEEIDPTFEDINTTYVDKNNTFAEYSEDYLNYWLGTVPEEWINSNIPNEMTWKDQYEKLKYRDFRNDFYGLEQFGEYVEEALVTIGFPNNEKTNKFDNNLKEIIESYRIDCENMLNNWAKLSDNVFVARRTLLEQTPRDLISQYFPSSKTYRTDSPEEFVYMYWTRLTQNSLKILIEDADNTAGDKIENVLKEYGDMFPLKRDGDKELDPNEAENAYEALKPILLLENYEVETIGSGALPTDANYAELKKLLVRMSEPSLSSVPNEKRKRIERIWQVLQGLPMDHNPYYCKISLVSPISVVRTRRIEIEQNGIKSGRKSIDTAGSDEVCRVEYGTDKSIYINFYQYPDEEKDPNAVKQFGPFEGRWAILQILHSHPGDSKDVQICLPVPDKDENSMIVEKQLYLKLEFFDDKACKDEDRIEGFGQALLSKE